MSKRKPLPSQEALRNLFDYDAAGFLINRNRPVGEFISASQAKRWKTAFAGKPAGGIKRAGRDMRHMTYINGIEYVTSRLIWKYHYGTEPDMIDHADRDTLNNKIENLRAANAMLNTANSAGRSSTGFKGVHARPDIKKFFARIRVSGELRHLGYFETAEDASAAYQRAAEENFGKFACTDHRSATK